VNRRLVVFVLAGLAVAVLLAGGMSRFASSQPDGLEKVAADQGIDTRERDHLLADGPFADDTAEGVDDGLGTGVAGMVGVVVTFAVASGAVWLVTKRRGRPARDATTSTT
jgi:cobalt/nickel transport system permease protein